MTGAAPALELAFGEIRHTRLRPVRHALRHRGFYCRIPVHALADLPRATRLFGVNRFAPLAFHESDHGDGRTPLLRWIRSLTVKVTSTSNSSFTDESDAPFTIY
ncbi:MAG: DUF1365 family protein [Burkholderiales bacterium]|nr:MAG: DUF1365 family protein [Burkholderiales bacterium]